MIFTVEEKMTMELSKLITQEKLQTSRNIRDFRRWILDAQSQFDQTEESRKFARLTKGSMQIYRDEVLPVLNLIDRLPIPDDSTIRFPCNGPFDAEIFTADNAEFAMIQVVNAVDGQDTRLRMELLTELGHVSAFGEIARDKKSGEICSTGIAVEATEYAAEVASLVKKAIRLKMVKHYPSKTWLLVNFMDSLLREAAISSVVSAAKSVIIPSKFKTVFLVGTSDQFAVCERLAG